MICCLLALLGCLLPAKFARRFFSQSCHATEQNACGHSLRRMQLPVFWRKAVFTVLVCIGLAGLSHMAFMYFTPQEHMHHHMSQM